MHHREEEDAVGDEVRTVLSFDDDLAQTAVAEVGHELRNRLIRVRGGDELQQPHVPRRIEEVRAEPVFAEIGREAFGELGNRQPGGVRADERAGPANAVDLFEQGALGLELLDDGFDDPIRVGQPLQVVFKNYRLGGAGRRRR